MSPTIPAKNMVFSCTVAFAGSGVGKGHSLGQFPSKLWTKQLRNLMEFNGNLFKSVLASNYKHNADPLGALLGTTVPVEWACHCSGATLLQALSAV